jgi:hypothetical protein
VSVEPAEPFVDRAAVDGRSIADDELAALNELADEAGVLVRRPGTSSSRRIHLPDPQADHVESVCCYDADEWMAKPAECFPAGFRDWCRYCKVGFAEASRERRLAIRAIDPQALGWEISGLVGGDGA